MEKISRILFFTSLGIFFLGASFLYGAFAYRGNHPPIPQLKGFYQSLKSQGVESYHLQPSRGQGSGVIVNTRPDNGSLVFMGGFFDGENQLRLVRRDGAVVRKWSLDYLGHFPDPATRPCGHVKDPLQTDTHGAHITPRGEVVFTYEYCGAVKLDQCGAMSWSIEQPTHHSLIPAEAGGYWMLGTYEWLASEHPDRFPPFSMLVARQQGPLGDRPLRPVVDGRIYEDTILRVGENGEVLEEFSIPELMRENGLGALLTIGDLKRRELVHANKIAELPAAIAEAYPSFEAGDLAISVRSLNLIMVLDPRTKEVKWHQAGPWVRQHDPEFRPDGRLSIFNNNVHERVAYVAGRTDLSLPRTTNIIAVHPGSRETEILFGEAQGEEMLSVIRGEHEILPDDGLLIAEFDAGRVLEVDKDRQIVWEYVNKYDGTQVGEVVSAGIFQAEYFEVEWKTCKQ
ncbi:MAG: hypothetical protein GY927_23515 [bacterium]|nr:hypothetical protein [bacterium]